MFMHPSCAFLILRLHKDPKVASGSATRPALVHIANASLCTILMHPYASLRNLRISLIRPSYAPGSATRPALVHHYASLCTLPMHPYATLHNPTHIYDASFSRIRFGNPAHLPPPPPGPCPGGTLSACIALCPASPPKAYTDCVEECGRRCPPPAGAAAG